MPKYRCIRKCFRAKPDGVSMHLYKKDEVEEFKNDFEAGNHFLRQMSPKDEMKARRRKPKKVDEPVLETKEAPMPRPDELTDGMQVIPPGESVDAPEAEPKG